VPNPLALTKLGSTTGTLQIVRLPHNMQCPQHRRHHVSAQVQPGMAYACNRQRRLRSRQWRLCKTVLPMIPSRLSQDANRACSTTTELTTSWASSIAAAFGLDPLNRFVEYAIRGVRLPSLTHHTCHASPNITHSSSSPSISHSTASCGGSSHAL
jgi:hypothetical protein